jgi:hypothetical protein
MEYVRALFKHRLLNPDQVEQLFSEVEAAALGQIKPRFLRCRSSAAL